MCYITAIFLGVHELRNKGPLYSCEVVVTNILAYGGCSWTVSNQLSHPSPILQCIQRVQISPTHFFHLEKCSTCEEGVWASLMLGPDTLQLQLFRHLLQATFQILAGLHQVLGIKVNKITGNVTKITFQYISMVHWGVTHVYPQQLSNTSSIINTIKQGWLI